MQIGWTSGEGDRTQTGHITCADEIICILARVTQAMIRAARDILFIYHKHLYPHFDNRMPSNKRARDI